MSSGVSCRRLMVRAAMRSLLRHAHTDVRRSGRLQEVEATSPGPRAVYDSASARSVTIRCGGAGIRTQGDPKASAVFKTAAFDRSATPPDGESPINLSL